MIPSTLGAVAPNRMQFRIIGSRILQKVCKKRLTDPGNPGMIGTVNNERTEMNASELILRAIEVVAILIAVGFAWGPRD